jgi:hypothetical protein
MSRCKGDDAKLERYRYIEWTDYRRLITIGLGFSLLGDFFLIPSHSEFHDLSWKDIDTFPSDFASDLADGVVFKSWNSLCEGIRKSHHHRSGLFLTGRLLPYSFAQ